MSLNSSDNECSEVIDNNYSFRSVSDESLSCDDEEESLARELMIKMTPAVLSKLRRSFKKNRDKSHGNNIDRKVEQVMRAAAAQEGIEFAAPSSSPEHSLCLDEEGFVSALDNIFGHHKFTTHAHKLFKLLDPFCSGRVWWRQLINRLVAVGAKRTSSRADLWKPLREGMMKRLEHCKRETIVKLVSVEKEDSFCYVAVSKGGRVGIYSGELQLLASYEVFYHRTGIRRRVKNSWITDVIYLGNVKCLILAASDRSLTVYDATTLTHTPIFCITGIPNIPMCLAYTPMSPFGNTSELALGTERGDLIRIRFLQPRISLFYSKTPENINYYFWTELSSAPHTTYCAVTTWRSVHSRTIRRVAYTRDGDILLSCSHDSMVSVRSRHVPGKLNDYVFKLQRGVTCFHVISPLHLLATGSCDGVVRLWETTQSTPFATLAAPTTPAVLDVVVVAAEEIVLAYCNNCTIHIWDMYEECLLQSIKLKYPFLGILGKRVEFGTYCIHPGPARKSLSDNDTPSDPPIEAFSRRGSSVYQGSSGGLILQTEPKDDWQTRGLEQEPEYIRFNRPELMFTCCDYISVLKLKDTELGDLLPPPGDTLRARRPSIWELPEDVMMAPLSSRTSPRSPRAPSPSPSPGHLLTPSTAEFPTHDLDTLLKNAGLEGILEKDFVLMQGLKQDLNRKLADMKANMSEMSAAVNAGAPYLALKTFEPVPMEPVDEMMDAYKRVMKCEHSCNSDGKRIFNTQEKFKVMTNLAYKVGKQVISLAEGMPNEGVFPFSKIDIEMKGGGRLFMEGKDLSAALQYIPSQGLPSLLTELRQFQDYMHRPPPLPRDVMVTNGGQHGIYQCVDLLMETGDPIIVNEYAYTGAHSSLKPYQPEIIGIPEDEFGLIPETLELVLSDRLACGMKMPKVLYLIPTGSNPSGTVLPEERRRRIYEMACRYDFLIIEDDPYVFLNYSDKNVPSFLSLDTCGRVIRLDSLSKVVSSGLRAGWVTAPLPVLQKLELHMQAELLHSCTLSQVILLHMISHREALASHLKAARDLYRNRRDALNYALRGVTDLAEWTVPEAGLFFWVRVRGIEDVYNMVFRTAFNRGLMVVPGQAFSFDTTAPCQYLRLTFSKVRYEDMDRAAHHLAEIIKEEQQLTLQKQPQRLATER